MYDLEIILRTTKQGLKRKLDSNWYFTDHYQRGLALLKRRGLYYSLADLEDLACFMSTSHDDCVVENPEDFSPVEVYQSKRNLRAMNRALDKIAELKKLEKKVIAAYGA